MSGKATITQKELNKAFLSHPVHWLALGFGTGLVPKAPGTAGTLVAIPLILLTAPYSFLVKLVILVAISLVGIYLCGKSAELLGVHDHGAIVWDEIAGFYLTALFIPVTPLWLILGFISFRIFDIIKPWPIKQLDAQVHGGLGIMVDDIIAGIFAGGILYLARLIFLHFGITGI